MNSIEKLSDLFSKFPGIGPRQAKRFVYFLLSRNGDYPQELVRGIEDLKKEIMQCDRCFKFYAKNVSVSKTCSICLDDTIDNSLLLIVPRDVDLEVIERSGSYKGFYFVLGGVVPILDKEPEKKIRARELDFRIKSDSNIKEIILAMNANIDGENTGEYIKDKYKKDSGITFSALGRGLSTGAEIEYADPETLKNALLHRTK